MDPIDVLLSVPDPTRRGRAHLTLGRQALDAGRTTLAMRHFREAERLVPADPEVLSALHLANVSTPSAPVRPKSWLGWRRRTRSR